MARSIDPIPPLSPRSRWEAPLQPPEPERDAALGKQPERDARRRTGRPVADGRDADGDVRDAEETADERPPAQGHVDVRA